MGQVHIDTRQLKEGRSPITRRVSVPIARFDDSPSLPSPGHPFVPSVSLRTGVNEDASSCRTKAYGKLGAFATVHGVSFAECCPIADRIRQDECGH